MVPALSDSLAERWFASSSAWTETPYRFARADRVSPRRTVCVRSPVASAVAGRKQGVGVGAARHELAVDRRGKGGRDLRRAHRVRQRGGIGKGERSATVRKKVAMLSGFICAL